VNAERLQKWVNYLTQAARNETDPFYLWAKICLDPRTDDARHLGELVRGQIKAQAKRQQEWADNLKNAEVILDYSQPDAPWLPDDLAFGSRPARTGDLRWSSDPDLQVPHLVEIAAAEKDRSMGRLMLTSGTEADAGAPASHNRAGRTICTPTFTLTSGKLFYLMKGNAQVYSAVSQHVMIAGPLHGRLVQTIQAGSDYRWVGQDLSMYKGMPAHIEFTAQDGSDFGLAMVVQSDRAPANPVAPIIPGISAVEDKDELLVQVAKSWEGLVVRTFQSLEKGSFSADQKGQRLARTANWLIQHPELCGKTKQQLSESLVPFFEEESKLAAQFQRQSRLALAIQDGSAFDEHVFIRGSPRSSGDLVPRRFLEALDGVNTPAKGNGSGRLQLARQITNPEQNPFVTRVIVNRVWQHLMGRGIVTSADNFGVLGEKPTHPELLDYLAMEFVREGWSIKKLIRTIVLSSAYQMSCRPSDKAVETDPQNLLWQHQPLRRLEGESIRDAMLALSGRLDEKMYGRSVSVHLTSFQDGRGRPESGPLDGANRRSLYLGVRRNFLSPFLLAFDTPIPFSTVGRRTVSNVPAQALILMNDPFVAQQAERWANKILKGNGSETERIQQMYLQAFARAPNEMEMAACVEFLHNQAPSAGMAPAGIAAWIDLAHVLFNAKEFIWLQ
jgi:hypothetical protein